MTTFFLDIDGVLTTSGTYKRYVKAGGSLEWGSIECDPNLPILFAPKAVGILQELVDAFNPEVVLSTSWRNHVDYDTLCALLRDAGGLRLNIVGKTPRLHPIPQAWAKTIHPTRGDEVHAYIEKQGLDPKNILIFEDEEDMRPYRNRQVHTSYSGTKSGLLPKHLRVARRILQQGPA